MLSDVLIPEIFTPLEGHMIESVYIYFILAKKANILNGNNQT